MWEKMIGARVILARAILALPILALPILALTASGAAAQVRVGLITTLSGPGAALGQQQRDGFLLGLATLGGKLGGMAVETTVVDDELKPDVAVARARDLIDGKHVDFVVGPIFSNVLAAIVKPVVESGAFLISPNAGPSTFAGRGCLPNLFVTSYENTRIHAVMGEVATRRGYKRVFLLAPNYQAGRDSMNGFKSTFKGEIVEEAYVPLTQVDFQAELAKIAATKPDAIFTFMPGGLGIALVKQYRQAGLQTIPFLSAFTVDESVLPAEQDAALGFYSAANYAPNMDNPANTAFVAAYQAKYGGVPASYAAQAYDSAMLLDAALKQAGGTGDKAKLRKALETAAFTSVRGNFRFGPNHYPIQDFYLAQVAKRADGKFQTEVREKIFSDDADPFGAQCKM